MWNVRVSFLRYITKPRGYKILINPFRKIIKTYYEDLITDHDPTNRFISNWLKTITNIIPLAEDGEGVIGNPSIMGPLIAVLSMIGES